MEFKINFSQYSPCNFEFEINDVEGEVADFGRLVHEHNEDYTSCSFKFVGKDKVEDEVLDKYDIEEEDAAYVISVIKVTLDGRRCSYCE